MFKTILLDIFLLFELQPDTILQMVFKVIRSNFLQLSGVVLSNILRIFEYVSLDIMGRGLFFYFLYSYFTFSQIFTSKLFLNSL